MSENEEDTITLRDVREIKSKLKIERSSKGSFIVAVVIDTLDFENNKLRNIPCKRGEHVNNGVYDQTRDCYCVECVEHYTIGDIPISYKMKMEGTFSWEVYSPLPEVVIKRYLSDDARKSLDDWKARFKKDKHIIRYLQITRVY
jgi:hypothetical protein